MSNPQPQEQDNRRRRKSRKPPADANAGEDLVQTDETIARPRQKNQNRKKKNTQPNESALAEQLQEADAATSPRPSTGNANRLLDQEVQTGPQKGTHKKRNANQNNPTGNKQHRNTTPSKPHVNMDAYAGPTFHASPAPSALPLPSRFSRSAPSNDNNKEVGIRARLQQEDSTGSSGGDSIPNSPLARPSAQRVVSQGDVSGGPALFDMLINADREEKARLQRQTLSPPQPNTRENSVSPVHAQTLPRSQHNRLSSESHQFPLQASTANAQSPSHATRQPAQLGTPYGHFSQQPHPDDAKLKRMLFSSPPQGSPSNAQYGSPSTAPQWESPTSRASASPYGSPASSGGLASSSRPAPISPYTQASPSPSARRSAYPPYHNSNLRRELSPGGLNHTPPNLGNLPRYNPGNGGSPLASPTHQRFNNSNSPFNKGGYSSPNRNSQDGNKRFSAQDALNSIGHQGQMSDMEDRLRQMLRIGTQGTQSGNAATASAVPS